MKCTCSQTIAAGQHRAAIGQKRPVRSLSLPEVLKTPSVHWLIALDDWCYSDHHRKT